MTVQDVPEGSSTSIREAHGTTAITGKQGFFRRKENVKITETIQSKLKNWSFLLESS